MAIDSDGSGRDVINLEHDKGTRSTATVELDPEPHARRDEEDGAGTEEEEEDTGTEEEEDEESDGSSPTRVEPETLQQVELRTALERLQSMCLVLGIEFKKKLLEMGATSVDELNPDDVSRINEQITFLQCTINANYTKIKATGKDLLREWELCDTPFRRMMGFAHVISVSDSVRSEDVTDAHFLSTKWLKKAQDEAERLQKDRKKSEKKEYENHKGKLKQMVFENHLSWENVGYDPQKKVVAERYPQETCEIRKKIEKAKDLSVGRKELVFRVELVRQLIEQETLSPHIIRGHLEVAKNHVEKINKDLPVLYDGENVSILLDKFKEEIDTLECLQNTEEEKKARMQRIRTRHGRSPSASADDH